MTACVPARTGSRDVDATVAWHDRVASLSVGGSLDFSTARAARRLLVDVLEQAPNGLLVDVRNACVDSSGVGVLVYAAQRARQERREFQLRCSGRLAAILRLHGLDELLGISNAPSTDDANRESDQARPLAA
jgi:anti-anti-sigma factor